MDYFLPMRGYDVRSGCLSTFSATMIAKALAGALLYPKKWYNVHVMNILEKVFTRQEVSLKRFLQNNGIKLQELIESLLLMSSFHSNIEMTCTAYIYIIDFLQDVHLCRNPVPLLWKDTDRITLQDNQSALGSVQRATTVLLENGWMYG